MLGKMSLPPPTPVIPRLGSLRGAGRTGEQCSSGSHRGGILRSLGCGAIESNSQSTEGRAMTWYKVDLTLGDVTRGKEIKISDEFGELFMSAGGPRGAALFGRGMPGGDMALYFSPAAALLAKVLVAAHGGEPCQAPPKEGTTPLVGHQDEFEMLA